MGTGARVNQKPASKFSASTACVFFATPSHLRPSKPLLSNDRLNGSTSPASVNVAVTFLNPFPSFISGKWPPFLFQR